MNDSSTESDKEIGAERWLAVIVAALRYAAPHFGPGDHAEANFMEALNRALDYPSFAHVEAGRKMFHQRVDERAGKVWFEAWATHSLLAYDGLRFLAEMTSRDSASSGRLTRRQSAMDTSITRIEEGLAEYRRRNAF
jgi:hypothetical protein